MFQVIYLKTVSVAENQAYLALSLQTPDKKKKVNQLQEMYALLEPPHSFNEKKTKACIQHQK